MRMKVGIFTVMTLLLLSSQAAWSVDNLVDSVAKGCEKELATFCSTVTPGDGRLLACMYAHSDKLSGQCEYALYGAAVQLERFVAALSYIANECNEDLHKYCSDVAAGQGRLLTCLGENSSTISSRCSQALKDVARK